ncbi:MAG: hypothetical protein RR508_00340 [Oscillospiraceae bacterium]
MRITHNMLTSNYLSSVNKNLKNLSGSNDRLGSQRAFNKASENVAGADKALRVRRLLTDNEAAVTTMADLDARYEAAENSMRAINDIVGTVTDDLMRGMNGTMDVGDRDKLAREIENLQGHVLQTMNAKYSDKYMFASSGNKDGSAPFTVDGAGALSYNGTPVDSMTQLNGKPMMPDGVTPIPYNKRNYVDVGLGFELSGTGMDAAADPRTAMPSTFSGVETFGYGKDENGLPKNAYSLLGKISKDLREGNTAKLSMDLDAVKSMQSDLLVQVTDVGNLCNFNEQTTGRMKSDILNLQEVQNAVEAVPLEKEMMANKDFEMSWMITLQLGSKILPQSIFNFLN